MALTYDEAVTWYYSFLAAIIAGSFILLYIGAPFMVIFLYLTMTYSMTCYIGSKIPAKSKH